MPTRLGAGLILAGIALLGTPASAQNELELNRAVYDQAWKLTRDAFYDRSYHGHDWEALREKHRPAVERAQRQSEVHEAIAALKGVLLAAATGDTGGAEVHVRPTRPASRTDQVNRSA